MNYISVHVLKGKLRFCIIVLAFAEIRFQAVIFSATSTLASPSDKILKHYLSIFCASLEHPATSRRFNEFARCTIDLNG